MAKQLEEGERMEEEVRSEAGPPRKRARVVAGCSSSGRRDRATEGCAASG